MLVLFASGIAGQEQCWHSAGVVRWLEGGGLGGSVPGFVSLVVKKRTSEVLVLCTLISVV